MKALITGVAGFAGSHLAEHLLAEGDQIIGTSRTGEWSADAPAEIRAQVDLRAWDLANDWQPLADSLAAEGVEAIYHLAAVSVPSECGRGEATARAVAANVTGTDSVVQLARRLSTRPRLLFVSSCYVYAPVNRICTVVGEDANTGPLHGYGKTKLAAEGKVREAVAGLGLDAVIARAFQHTGPRQSKQMIVPDWAHQFVVGADPIRVVCLDTFLDLSDVRDVVRAYRRLVLDGRAGEVYNVGSGRCIRSGDLFTELRQLASPDRRFVETAPGRRMHPIAETSRLTADTAWKPTISTTKTLQDTLEYWQRKVETE